MTSTTKDSSAYSISDLVDFLYQYKAHKPECLKDEITAATTEHFRLLRKRVVYFSPGFAIRFSSTSRTSFSNTVLGLSTLKLYDKLPFIVCIVRSENIELLLANSTFLKKISHSSKKLQMDNVRGSFLGQDILQEYTGVSNVPENFEELFSIHQEFTWEENLARLVEATNKIVPTGVRFSPTRSEIDNILSTVDIAHFLARQPEYLSIGSHLNSITSTNRTAILEAGKINNVNVRGNTIEQIITQAANSHKLEDLSYTLSTGTRVMVDVKTKILTLTSSPKGYNINKVLKNLAEGNTIFSFFFVGLNVESQTMSTRLVSFLDQMILNVTRIRHHWAGRNSKGATQLGDVSSIFESNFQETVRVAEARMFLHQLINL